MKVETLDEAVIADIGHAFGYYDYGAEQGLASAFPSREAMAAFIRRVRAHGAAGRHDARDERARRGLYRL